MKVETSSQRGVLINTPDNFGQRIPGIGIISYYVRWVKLDSQADSSNVISTKGILHLHFYTITKYEHSVCNLNKEYTF